MYISLTRRCSCLPHIIGQRIASRSHDFHFFKRGDIVTLPRTKDFLREALSEKHESVFMRSNKNPAQKRCEQAYSNFQEIVLRFVRRRQPSKIQFEHRESGAERIKVNGEADS